MIKQTGIFISFIFLLICSTIVHSYSVDDRKLQSVVHNLVVWIYEQNHFNYQNVSPPRVKIIDETKLTALAYGNSYVHKIKDYNYDEVLGLYNYRNSTIYISHQLDLNSKQGQSILLHELVHHFQYMSGEADKVTHISQLEPYAYFLERKFSKQYSLIASNKHIH